MSNRYKYKAFISYSHADIRFGRWLHKKIENYKIPKSLREKYPNLPKDLKRSVFRDEEELPTGSNLPDNLTEALEQSEILIVIASLNAVKSEWVSKEIAYFKSYHGEDRVLAIIKEGEPSEAFPKALKYKVDSKGELTDIPTEPIAGDARSFWGRKRGLMKLIAGILGVDFADLWDREKKEARKRGVIKIIFTLLFITISIFGYLKYNENNNIKNYGVDYIKTLKILNKKRALLKTDIFIEQKNNLNNDIKKLEKILSDLKMASESLSKIEGAFAQETLNILEQKGAKEAERFIDSKESFNEDELLKDKLINKYWVRINVYIANQKYKEANKYYSNLIKLDDSYLTICEYANFLLAQHEYSRAIPLYEKLLTYEVPNSIHALILNNLGIAYKNENILDKTEKSYLKSIEYLRNALEDNSSLFKPILANTFDNLGNLYRKKGELGKVY